MHQNISLKAEVTEDLAGKRLDQALALLFTEHSRSRLKDWIENECVWVNDQIKRPKDKVTSGDKIQIQAQILEQATTWAAEAITLNIIYEDEHIIVINKPIGLVVHPAVGNRNGTLVNALLHRFPDLNQIPRAGVVHRLDKDTSGLMVVAKTLVAHTELVSQLQARTVSRIYETVVGGILPAGGTINAPIARHPKDRMRMSVVPLGKSAVTHYRVIEKFKAHTHLRVHLETGRTHQIRVHMAYIHHPIVGDKTYGGRLRLPPNSSESLRHCLQNFPRQALHATGLGLIHPLSQEEMFWEAPLPEDMQQLLMQLRLN